MKILSPTFAGSSRRLSSRKLGQFAVFAFLLFFFVVPAFAQEATLVGTVTDPSGAAVSNATITITNIDTGVSRTLATSGDGQYVAPGLLNGHYTVKVAVSGFKAAEQSGITLQVGDRSRVDFKLQVGSAQEQVTVEANA